MTVGAVRSDRSRFFLLFHSFPIKLSCRPASLRGRLSISSSSVSSLRHFLSRNTLGIPAVVASSPHPQPIAAINGRRRSAIRTTRVTVLQPRSTVRELPFVVPLEPFSHPGVVCVWNSGRSWARQVCIGRGRRVSIHVFVTLHWVPSPRTRV